MVKCYTKKKSDGGSYTTCIGFQAKSGKTKPKAKPKAKPKPKSKLKGKTITIKRKIKKKKKVKPTAKGVMTIQKKIKGTKKLENKSTIKPLISKPKAKPKYGRMKPKPKAKILSAGKAVLMGLPINMKTIGQYVITKKEKRRRLEVIENSIQRNTRGGETMLYKKIKSREAVFREFAYQSYLDYDGLGEGSGKPLDLSSFDAQRLARRIKWKKTQSKKILKSLQKKRKKITTLLTEYTNLGGRGYGEKSDAKIFIKNLDREIGKIEKIIKTPDNKLTPTTYKQDRLKMLKERTKDGPPMYPDFWSQQGRIGGQVGSMYDNKMSEIAFLTGGKLSIGFGGKHTYY